MVQKALVILHYRAKNRRESIEIKDIAAEAGCSYQNLHQSLEFNKALNAAREGRIKRGWKFEGVADCVDDSISN
jgi:hypothetical protein